MPTIGEMNFAVDYDRLDSIRTAALNRRAKRAWLRTQPPAVYLYDGDWALRGMVRGVYSVDAEWARNDSAPATIAMPMHHHLAIWALAQRDAGTARNIHVRIDVPGTGARWCGRASEVTAEVGDVDGGEVTITFLHDVEELKHLLVWPNPASPAALQFPKVWGLALPSVSAIKLTLLINLIRMQSNWLALPDDPLDPASYLQSVDYTQWPILVKPTSLLLDDSEWTILQGRFDTVYDCVHDILEDGGLMIDARRWFPGDPQPWPGANLHRPGQLVVDVVDKSGWFGQSAVGGTIAGGALRTILEVADDLVDEARRFTGEITNPAEYAVSGWMGVAPSSPWVVYRNDGRPGGIRTADKVRVTWKPATVGQVVTGGTSMPGVEEALEAVVQTIGAVAAAFMAIPNLAEPALTLIKPLMTNTILAFMSYKHLSRTRRMGWSHYLEDWGGEGTAYTLSGILSTRAAIRATDDKVTVTAEVSDGSPYLIGEKGFGHYWLGDRVSIQDPTSPDGRYITAQCSGLKMTWGVSNPAPSWGITIGERDDDRDAVTRVTRQTKRLGTMMKESGLMA